MIIEARSLEAALREDAEGFREGGGTRLAWIVYIMGDCAPPPPARAVLNLNLIALDVWRDRMGDGPCS